MSFLASCDFFLFPGVRVVILSLFENVGPLISMEPLTFRCILCETEVGIETLLTFSSTTIKYQVLVSQVAFDYLSWTSSCSSKLFILISYKDLHLFRKIIYHD